jgi:multidrug resistance efflux pump
MMRRLLVIAVVLGAVALGYRYDHRGEGGVLSAFGTLEARNVDVGSKNGGRVASIDIHEGDRVRQGQVLLTLDDDQLRPAVAEAEAALAAARANLARIEHGSRAEDIAEARAAANADGTAAAGFRRDEVAQAEAELARARANATNADKRLDRARDLLARGMTPQQAYDDARAEHDVAHAAVAAADHALAAANGRFQAARAVTARTVNGSRSEDVDAARAEAARAEAALATAQSRLAEQTVRAPADAVVEVFDLRPGQLVLPNAPLVRLLEANQLFVMVYVPEPRIGEVTLGAAVAVTVDAYPGRSFRGVVEQIRQRAEFLPRNVQTREERIHQVIGVKVRLEDPRGELRAGINAEVRFDGTAAAGEDRASSS